MRALRQAPHPSDVKMPTEDVEPTSQASGLTTGEVSRRLERFGLNRLTMTKGPSAALIFLRQFLSPLIYILLAAALVSLATGEAEGAIFIAVVLIVNAVIGTVQEYSAERAAVALRQLQAPVRPSGEMANAVTSTLASSFPAMSSS